MPLAGVHTYSENDDTLAYVNQIMVGIYHRKEKDAVIDLPQDGTYVDMMNGHQEYVSRAGMLHIPFGGIRAKMLVKKEYL